MLVGNLQTSTGPDGIAKFAIPDGASYLDAKQGADTAMLPNSAWYWDDSTWNTRPVYDELRWYVFDDRQMYRPGEEVHVKGWLRRVVGKQAGDVDLVGSSVSAVSYRPRPQGNDRAAFSRSTLWRFDFLHRPRMFRAMLAHLERRRPEGCGYQCTWLESRNSAAPSLKSPLATRP
jgi:hypothetical protein